MHDCYQQSNPLNEAPLNGNTIIPQGLRKKDKISFFCFAFFYCSVCSMGSISATQCMKVRVQGTMQNGPVEEKMATGGAAFCIG